MSDLVAEVLSILVSVSFIYMYLHFLYFRRFVIDKFVRNKMRGFSLLNTSEAQRLENNVYLHSGYSWKGLNIYTSFPNADTPPFFLLPFILIQIEGDGDVYNYAGSHQVLDIAVLKNWKFLYGKAGYNPERGEVGVLKGPDIGRIFIYRLGFFTWKKDVKHVLQYWIGK